LKPGFDEVWKRRIPAEHMPARAGIGAGNLGPRVLVEMVVIAAKA